MKKLFIVISILFSSCGLSFGQILGLNGSIYHTRATFNDPVFVDSVQTLHADIIREPGGNSSYLWDWKTDKNLTIASIAKLHTKILFVLNIKHTLKDQLDMLDEAAANGIDFYCEIGNEVNNDRSLYIKMFADGIVFGKFCQRWSDSIHAHFPNCKVGVWGAGHDSSFPNWTKEILSVYTPDALCVHVYPAAISVSTNGLIDSARLYKHIADKLKESGLYTITTVPLWITEYNLAPDNLSALKKFQHRKALVMMTNYFRNNGVELMCMHNLYGTVNGAYYYVNNKLVLGVTGKAFKKIKDETQK